MNFLEKSIFEYLRDHTEDQKATHSDILHYICSRNFVNCEKVTNALIDMVKNRELYYYGGLYEPVD